MSDTENFFGEIRNGNVGAVEKLLGTNMELLGSKDERGSSPLILATYYNHIDLAKLLIGKGARIDATDGSDNTALMGVCFKGYTDLAKLLIQVGADVNHINTMGATCLIYATTFNRIEIAQLLLEHGADVNIKDARGNTAFDHAKMQENKPLMELFESQRLLACAEQIH